MGFDIFRHDPSYIFVWLDLQLKIDVEAYAAVRMIDDKKQIEPITVEKLQEENPYKRYGKQIPKNIPNSPKFFQSKLFELIAMTDHMNRQPDLLLTLTSKLY